MSTFFLRRKAGGGRQMTVTSGQRCSALLTKSGPLGSLVKMLLESPLWWSPARQLIWETRPLYSRRMTEFTDSNLDLPSPSNASAEILNQRDIPSSRCLFRLAVSERPIEEIESFSSRTTILLQTPSTREVCESPQQMQQRKERNGYRNGTKYNGLMSQLMHDPQCARLLPTPRANKVNDMDLMNPKLANRNKWNLEEVVAKMILPTPAARDWKGRTNPGVVKEGSGCIYGETLPDAVERLEKDSGQKRDGVTSRLSPLFTEEMMGFPLMWTALPFLLRNGETSQSKPMEMQ